MLIPMSIGYECLERSVFTRHSSMRSLPWVVCISIVRYVRAIRAIAMGFALACRGRFETHPYTGFVR
jgi:hypothetical protein